MIHSLLETSAFAVIGFITGEFLHRLSLYWRKRDLRGVFSNRHQQHWKCPCLLLLALLIIVSSGQNSEPQQVLLRIIPITVVYALFRLSGVTDNSDEEETILRENHAELGPGLAANYFHGFLQVLLHCELVVYEYVNTIEAKMTEFCQNIHYEGARHDKMFIILPRTCKFYADKDLLEDEERIFKFSNHELSFNLRGKDPKRICLYWICEDKQVEDEIFQCKDREERRKKVSEMDEKVKKILFVWDFPTILMRAMGPGTGRADRARNIRTFKETIQVLSGPANIAIQFLEIAPRQRRTEPLSTVIRSMIKQ